MLEIEEQPAVLQDLGPLNGLPGDARYRPVVGKSPSSNGWNSDPSQWLTAEQVLKERALSSRWTGIGLLTGSKVGRLCWLDFDGEETDPETGELVKSASLDFELMFGRAVSALPPCPINISGRPGRFRALFRVPLEWTEFLQGFSITGSEAPTRALEFLYEKSGGRLFHAVVEGQHPDGQGWFYRWKEGCSPAEVAIPDLPVFVLAGLVRHIAKRSWDRQPQEAVEAALRTGGDVGPMDLLSPGRQRKCLRLMQAYWPYRGGKAGTGYSGEYGKMQRLVLSLVRGIDDWPTFESWLTGGEWDRKNDWAGKAGSAAVNGGELVAWAKSLAASETAKREATPWATAWAMAVENGWVPPKWALPPRDVDATQSLSTDSAKELQMLQQGLDEIDRMTNPAQRLAALQNLTRILGKSGAEMSRLLQSLEEGEDAHKAISLQELLASESKVKPVIQGLLARSCLTVLASQGGVAKTSLLYRMAVSIASGGMFAGKLQAIQGPVLVIQKDETEANAHSKMQLMDLAHLPEEVQNRIVFRFSWHPGMMPELKQWIRETGAVAVFMDSLGTLLGGGGSSLNDAEAALHLYRLNRMAAEMEVALVMTHHTRKASQQTKKPEGEPTKVRVGDLYGSSYIVNAASDVWSLVQDGGTPEEPLFALEVLKPRSGITQRGDRFEMQGNLEDLSFEFSTFNLSASADEITGTSAEKVLKVLRGRGPDTALTAMDVAAASQVAPSTVQRVLKDLYRDRKYTGLERLKPVGKGATKPPYVYWVGRGV